MAAWLGLGTNVGDRARNLAAAVHALHGIAHVEALSGVYETRPFGYLEQPDFWNMVVRVRTGLSPHELLSAVKALEPALGRVASFHMGPRVIDIDILLYGAAHVTSELLSVPHAGLMQRAFVLQPLAELDPALRHPVTGEAIADRARIIGDEGTRRLGDAADVLTLKEREE